MKWLMLCREPRLYSCRRIKQACEAKGIELDILDPNRMLLSLANGRFDVFYQEGERFARNRPAPQPLPPYQAVLPRFGTTSTVMGGNVLRHFESQAIPVLNNTNAFLLARDKWQSLQVLAANQIPVPATTLAGELVSAQAVCRQEKVPFVTKTLAGSQGVGVMLMEEPSSALSVLDAFKQANIPLLTQQFIAEAKGQDIRAFVIGDRVVAAMQRLNQSGDFRANIHLGASAQPIRLSEEEQQLAVNAAKAIGLDVAGVDLIRSAQGAMVLEVNASPGLEGIEQASGVDIAGLIVAYLSFKYFQM